MRGLSITAPHFCAGWWEDGLVAPIIAYMRPWTEARIRAYCARKGWKVQELEWKP